MIRQTGRVLSVEGPLAWIECLRGGSCGACPSRGACAAAGWAGAERSSHRLRARTRSEAFRPGAEVVVGIPEGALVRAALLAYGLPLGLLVVGALVGASLTPWAAVPGAALGTALGATAATAMSGRDVPAPVILESVRS